MPKKRPRSPIPPYRAGGLISASRFASFCHDRGVRTNRRELEFLDKMNLLVPAVVIYYGVGKEKDQNGKPVYVTHGVSFGNKVESYDFYGFRAKGVVEDDPPNGKNCDFYIPAFEPFKEWTFFGRNKPSISKRKVDLGKPADPFYSPEQIFALIDAKRSVGALKQNEDADLIQHEIDFVQRSIERKYKAIRLYHLADKLWFDVIRGNEKKLKQLCLDKEVVTEDEAKTEYLSMMTAWQKRYQNNEMTQLLKECGVKESEVQNLAEIFVHQGFFTDPNIEIFEWYRHNIPEKVLAKQKGATALCEDYYRIAERLLLVLGVVENKLLTLDDCYGTRSHRFMESCIVCSRGFIPNKARKGGHKQITCSPQCSEENKRIWKRKKRKESQTEL